MQSCGAQMHARQLDHHTCTLASPGAGLLMCSSFAICNVYLSAWSNRDIRPETQADRSTAPETSPWCQCHSAWRSAARKCRLRRPRRKWSAPQLPHRHSRERTASCIRTGWTCTTPLLTNSPLYLTTGIHNGSFVINQHRLFFQGG